MKNISIILPIYKLDADEIIMLNNAIVSIQDFHEDVKLLVVLPITIKEKLIGVNFGKLDTTIIYSTPNSSDFCSQVNRGIESCDTPWFSILEIDDEYKPIWLSSMKEYMEAYPDVQVFLPIVKDINVEGKFLSFTNDSVWAYGFSKNQGYLDNEILLEFQNYQTSGGLYNTQVIRDHGNFKENIKLTFSYEFLLRLTHNGVSIMVVPRAGYQHVVMRENSLFWMYKNDENTRLTDDEVKFWLETAKNEYFFKNKREVNYVKQ